MSRESIPTGIHYFRAGVPFQRRLVVTPLGMTVALPCGL